MTHVPLNGPRLTWTDERGQYFERPLSEGGTLIGRSPECDVVIDSAMVSRQHARFEVAGGAVTVRDLESRNGTFVNGVRVQSAPVQPGDQVTIGNVVLAVAQNLTVPLSAAQGETVAASEESGFTVGADGGPRPDATITMVAPFALPEAPQPGRGIVSDDLLSTEILRESDLVAAGVEVRQVEYVTLGGGMGSFVFTDLLRCTGVDARDIAAVGTEPLPYARYRRLAQNSQIPPHERIRSNSESRPDNIWGFPGYGPMEILRELKRGNLKLAGDIMWSLFGESAIAQTYTPRSGDVFNSMDREAKRIGWEDMLVLGRVRAIRKSDTGRLLVIVSHSTAEERRHSAISARFVHSALGYPAIQMLPDLAAYRERYGDFFHIVNAYEYHNAVYEQLRAQGGTVLLRGRGIVASRVLQRLYEERAHNPNINIIHLHRSRLTEGNKYGFTQRKVVDQWEFMAFNWPKGTWTGEHGRALRAADDEGRRKLLEAWGGTTTANRRDWRRIVREGLREGWYRSEFGRVQEVIPTEDGRVSTRIESVLQGGGTLELVSDFVIDCVGLDSGPKRAPVYNDLITMYNLPPGPTGKLRVTDGFEVLGLRNTDARMYAAGTVTLGGPQAAADSFLGLQFAAVWAMDDMLASGMRPRGLRPLRGLHSFRQWLKWARGVAP